MHKKRKIRVQSNKSQSSQWLLLDPYKLSTYQVVNSRWYMPIANTTSIEPNITYQTEKKSQFKLVIRFVYK